MKIVISIEHPAWAHQFRYLIRGLEEKGHTIKVVAIKKDRDLELLDAFGIQYEIISNSSGKNTFEKGIIFLKSVFRIFQISLRFKPDIFIGRASPMMAINSWLFRKDHIVFEDTENAKFCLLFTKLFTNVLITPNCFHKNLGSKHIKLEAFKETFYLHPNYFQANPDILRKLGVLLGDKYTLFRFVAWQAHHDIGQHGFTLNEKFRMVEEIQKYMRVFISSETPLPPQLEKYRVPVSVNEMHDVLYFAELLICDSQTMTTEAAVLGTPVVRYNTFVGSNDMGNFHELENKYGLIYCYQNYEKARQKALELITVPDLKKQWAQKIQKLISDKIDITKYMIDFIDNYPESFYIYKAQNKIQ